MMTINNKNIENRSITTSQANDNLGLYIHLPFCQRKCDYCSFISLIDQSEEMILAYLDHLLIESELQHKKKITLKPSNQNVTSQYLVDSVFLGGGTPSLVSGESIKKLLTGIRSHWTVSDDVEITMECNPNSMTPKSLAEYLDAGVNRLSIGIQSFDDALLMQIGRLHDATCAKEAITMAKLAGFENINLDLMFGLPGQTLYQWMQTLRMAISLEPSHLSLYTLQIEEGTKLYQDYRSEKMSAVDVNLDRKCYHDAIEFLKINGFGQYEISNFAKQGYECKHNIKYWSMENYLGLGLNASSHINGIRWKNLSSMELWMKAIQAHQLPMEEESLKSDTQREGMGIFLFTGLRKTQGISLLEFKNRFGIDFFQAFGESIDQLHGYRSRGLLNWTDQQTDQQDGRLWLTQAGIDYSNEIFSEFV